MGFKENVEHKTDWQANLQQDHIKQPRKVVIWDYRHLDELDTMWISDIHLGHHACDMDLVHRNIDHIGEQELPFMDLGDLIENSTRDSVGAGVYEQTDIAQEQLEQAVELYQPVKHLLQGMHPGNHEMRAMNKGGLNLTRIMAQMLDVPYCGVGVMHYIMVGKERYTGYSHHGGSGAATVGGKLSALLKLAEIIHGDFYIQGHVHDCILQARDKFELDPRSRTVKARTQYFINNGAYLNWWNTYGQVKAYVPGKKGNAQIKFSGLESRINVKFH